MPRPLPRQESLNNAQITAYIADNLPVFKRLVGVLSHKFPNPVVTPDLSMAEIMFSAGQYSVLEHFEHLIRSVEEGDEVNVIPGGGE